MLLAAATGLIGTGFHIYNVGKKAGGFSWQNLFYGAPLGAPMAILLVGPRRVLLGAGARQRHGNTPDDFRACRPGRTMAAVISAGLLGTTGEAGLLHFRGAFHNPFMMLPVTLPPLGRHAHGVGRRGTARPRSVAHALVDAAADGDGFCGRAAFTPTAYRATWAAGATGVRTCSTGRRFRRRRALPASRSPASPRSA